MKNFSVSISVIRAITFTLIVCLVGCGQDDDPRCSVSSYTQTIGEDPYTYSFDIWKGKSRLSNVHIVFYPNSPGLTSEVDFTYEYEADQLTKITRTNPFIIESFISVQDNEGRISKLSVNPNDYSGFEMRFFYTGNLVTECRYYTLEHVIPFEYEFFPYRHTTFLYDDQGNLIQTQDYEDGDGGWQPTYIPTLVKTTVIIPGQYDHPLGGNLFLDDLVSSFSKKFPAKIIIQYPDGSTTSSDYSLTGRHGYLTRAMGGGQILEVDLKCR